MNDASALRQADIAPVMATTSPRDCSASTTPAGKRGCLLRRIHYRLHAKKRKPRRSAMPQRAPVTVKMFGRERKHAQTLPSKPVDFRVYGCQCEHRRIAVVVMDTEHISRSA